MLPTPCGGWVEYSSWMSAAGYQTTLAPGPATGATRRDALGDTFLAASTPPTTVLATSKRGGLRNAIVAVREVNRRAYNVERVAAVRD